MTETRKLTGKEAAYSRLEFLESIIKTLWDVSAWKEWEVNIEKLKSIKSEMELLIEKHVKEDFDKGDKVYII